MKTVVRFVFVSLALTAIGCSAPHDGDAEIPDGSQNDVVAYDHVTPLDAGSSDVFDASQRVDSPVAIDVHSDVPSMDVPWSRDWTVNPAIVQATRPDTLYAVSDLHGGYARAAALFAANGLMPRIPTTARSAQWAAGNATLVVVGDMIDKGPQGLEVIDLLRTLQSAANATGGMVVVTLGNHEAEFLVNPLNSKATGVDGVDVEIDAMGLVPGTVATDMDDRGRWLRTLPFGARIGGWFFAHAGDTGGRTIAALETALHDAVVLHDYNDPEVIGSQSILESNNWFSSASTAPAYAMAVGATHIVMGHDPHALGPNGVIARTTDAALFRIDCGISPDVNYSTGVLLRVRRVGSMDIAEGLDSSGAATPVWTGPAAP